MCSALPWKNECVVSHKERNDTATAAARKAPTWNIGYVCSRHKWISFNIIYVIISHYNYTLSYYLLRQRHFNDTCTRNVRIQNVILCARDRNGIEHWKRFRSVSFNLNDVQTTKSNKKQPKFSWRWRNCVKGFSTVCVHELTKQPDNNNVFFFIYLHPRLSFSLSLSLTRWQTIMCIMLTTFNSIRDTCRRPMYGFFSVLFCLLPAATGCWRYFDKRPNANYLISPPYTLHTTPSEKKKTTIHSQSCLL